MLMSRCPSINIAQQFSSNTLMGRLYDAYSLGFHMLTRSSLHSRFPFSNLLTLPLIYLEFRNETPMA